MMTEEKRKIRGVDVIFPCKPYPSQFSFMDKVIQGIEKKQNCLLESPTGSGKSLALLCSALAWQTAEYNKKRQEEINIENSKGSECSCRQKHDVNKSKEHHMNKSLEEKSTQLPVKAGHISISIVKGQIAHQQVNVIVNTTSTGLQLNYGAVSQSLLCVGGPGLQKECNQKYPGGVHPGEVAETSGGNLKCDIICHGALLPWKETGSLQTLQTFMKNCLMIANEKGYKSVAFPALGTGNLGYPRDIVATEMFSCVDEFAKNNPSSSLVDVRFVVYGGDSHSVKVFEAKQKDRLTGTKAILQEQQPVTPSSKSTSTIVIPESDDEDDDFKPTSKFRTPGGPSQSVSSIRKHQSIGYETSPPCEAGPSYLEEEDGGCNCNCGSENKPQSRRVPKIYFGTRTHKQISQIVRELKKTAYRETRMTILASREHTCIHPAVSKSKNKNEGCKELMDGPGCKFNDKVKKVFPHYSNLQEYGLSEAWDLEDLVDVCQSKKACPYFSVRSFRKEVDIIFCPYNYLIDPVIREQMEINLKNEIVILDEAHNIEDSAREGASDSFTDEQLDKAYKEIHEMIVHEIKPVENLRLKQMVDGFMKLIQNNMDHLEQRGFDQAAKVISGYDIVVRMKEYGIGPEHIEHLVKCFRSVCEDMMDKSVKNIRGQTVKLTSATLTTLEHMFKIMDFMFRENLKYLEDYRVAILRSTSYVTDRNTDGAWVNSRNRRGGMKNTPKYVITLHFWCMNPGVAFSDLNDTRCVVLTSGTLSPMNTFESELGAAFPIKLEANHVIEDKQVWVGALSQGPTGRPLHAVYKTMETFEFQDELGKTLLQVCQEVPHGVLCFMPSYRSLDKFMERWKNSGIYEKISKVKKIIQEPRRSDEVDFDELMRYFYDTIHGVADDIGDDTTGALFLAVCRGKVSEGLDFADNFARAVITVGIPYPNWKDIQVGQKRMYNDKHKNARGLLSGSEWYEIQAFRALNQALGRCIRHRKDWGLLILADERFVKNRDKYCKGLSKWVRNKVQGFNSCKDAMESISTFAKERKKDMPVISADTSFIPGTPITPGENLHKRTCEASTIGTPVMPAETLRKRQSLYGASTLGSPLTPSTPNTPANYFHKNLSETPSCQDPKKAMSFSSPQLPNQPQFTSPEPNRAVPSSTSQLVTAGYRLLSPTEVKKSTALSAAATSGSTIQAQPGKQTKIILKNPQLQGQQLVNLQGQQLVNLQGQKLVNLQGQQLVNLQGQQLVNLQGQQLINLQGQQLINLQGQQKINLQGQQHINSQGQKPINLQGQQLINNFLMTPHYQQILAIMNTPAMPKDKPYYIMLDEGKPSQQMYLVEPSQQNSGGKIAQQPTTLQTQPGHVKINSGVQMAQQLAAIPAQLGTPGQVNKQTLGVTNQQQQSSNSGLISLLDGGLQTSTNSVPCIPGKADISKPVHSEANSSTPSSNIHPPSQKNLLQNKLFKYCNITEKVKNQKGDNNENNVSKPQNKSSAGCPQTPTLFDTQDSEQEIKLDAMKLQNLPDINSVTSDNENASKEAKDNESKKLNEDVTKNYDNKVHKKPIFRRHSVAPTITMEDDSQDEFKDQSKSNPRRKSCDKILTEIQLNTKENQVECTKNEEEEENESEEILKTRRRHRGAKRKSNSNLKNSSKKTKGVDFVDNIDDNDTKESVIKCKSCGASLMSQVEEFEKRKRYPNFVKVLTTQRNAVVLFIPSLDIHKTGLQIVSTKVKEGSDITLNSYTDPSTECVLQYLSCQSCTKDVVGIQVLNKGRNCRDLEEKQAWLVNSLVELNERKT